MKNIKDPSNVFANLLPSVAPLLEAVKQGAVTAQLAGELQQVLRGESSAASGDRIGPRGRVALVVGHNLYQQGARLLRQPVANGMSEFLFNSAVAQLIAARSWKQMTVKTFFREAHQGTGSTAAEINSAYNRVNGWLPDLTIEMHFNAGGGRYALCLCKEGDEETAKGMSDLFSERLGVANGGVRVVKKSERGGLSAYACKSPFVLAEPFFGDDAAFLSGMSAEKLVAKTAEAYLDGIWETLGGQLQFEVNPATRVA